jgi:hypothetical protein
LVGSAAEEEQRGQQEGRIKGRNIAHKKCLLRAMGKMKKWAGMNIPKLK